MEGYSVRQCAEFVLWYTLRTLDDLTSDDGVYERIPMDIIELLLNYSEYESVFDEDCYSLLIDPNHFSLSSDLTSAICIEDQSAIAITPSMDSGFHTMTVQFDDVIGQPLVGFTNNKNHIREHSVLISHDASVFIDGQLRRYEILDRVRRAQVLSQSVTTFTLSIDVPKREVSVHFSDHPESEQTIIWKSIALPIFPVFVSDVQKNAISILPFVKFRPTVD